MVWMHSCLDIVIERKERKKRRRKKPSVPSPYSSTEVSESRLCWSLLVLLGLRAPAPAAPRCSDTQVQEEEEDGEEEEGSW